MFVVSCCNKFLIITTDLSNSCTQLSRWLTDSWNGSRDNFENCFTHEKQSGPLWCPCWNRIRSAWAVLQVLSATHRSRSAKRSTTCCNGRLGLWTSFFDVFQLILKWIGAVAVETAIQCNIIHNMQQTMHIYTSSVFPYMSWTPCTKAVRRPPAYYVNSPRKVLRDNMLLATNRRSNACTEDLDVDL